jgi:uncharacterized protein YjeT (DUF2065 family)
MPMNTLGNIEIGKTFYFDILYIFVRKIKQTSIMLKELVKNSGLLVILAGVILLGVVVFTKVQTNTHLAISLVLIVGGLLAHILINKMVD